MNKLVLVILMMSSLKVFGFNIDIKNQLEIGLHKTKAECDVKYYTDMMDKGVK